MAKCQVKGCKNFEKEKGKCAEHIKAYEKRLEGEEGAKKPVMVPIVVQTISNDKDKYYGGTANQPHVHVYPGGAHLKLGKHRYNLVQDGEYYKSSSEDAYVALGSHALGDQLKPWVTAALKHFGFG